MVSSTLSKDSGPPDTNNSVQVLAYDPSYLLGCDVFVYAVSFLTVSVVLKIFKQTHASPRSFKGGDLHWIWRPYELYQEVDYVRLRSFFHTYNFHYSTSDIRCESIRSRGRVS